MADNAEIDRLLGQVSIYEDYATTLERLLSIGEPALLRLLEVLVGVEEGRPPEIPLGEHPRDKMDAWAQVLTDFGKAFPNTFLTAIRGVTITFSLASALGGLDDERAVDLLIGALEAKDPTTRWSVVRSLMEQGLGSSAMTWDSEKIMLLYAGGGRSKDRGNRRVQEPLIKALQDSDSLVRNQAVEALLALGDAYALAPLRRFVADPANGSSPEALQEAEQAIRSIEAEVNE
jgi:hypothetical protein